MTEANGIPIGVAIAGANCHDSQMVEATLTSIPVARPRPGRQRPQGMRLDKAYDSGEVRTLVKEFAYTAHICSRGAKKLKRSSITRASKHAVGSWNERTVG